MVVGQAEFRFVKGVPMRGSALIICAITLAACEPAQETASGVGFDRFGGLPATEVTPGSLDTGLVISGERSGANPDDLARASEAPGTRLTAAEAVAADTLVALDTQSATPAPDLNNPGISDEQNFEAVSNRQTIESDRERLERQRQQYTVIEPTALPRRPSGGANIVAFALGTSHAVGTKVYSRGLTASASRAEGRCARYISPDIAQVEFLEAGGPERDRLGLDPDGDGFACGWDPSPFRRGRG